MCLLAFSLSLSLSLSLALVSCCRRFLAARLYAVLCLMEVPTARAATRDGRGEEGGRGRRDEARVGGVRFVLDWFHPPRGRGETEAEENKGGRANPRVRGRDGRT